MPDKDELTEKFHDMKSRMTPDPELISRLMVSLEAESPTDVAAQPADNHAPATKPVTKPRSSRPTARRRRVGLLSGGVTAAVLAGAMVVGGLAGGTTATAPSQWPTWPDPVVVSGNVQPSSGGNTTADPQAYADIYKALASMSPYVFGFTATDSGGGLPVPSAADMGGRESAAYTSGTGTNVQVAGIDEGDIVKTDGSYLYVAKGRTVAVVAAQGSQSRQVASIEISGLVSPGETIVGPVMDMMIEGKTLVVLFHGFVADESGWSSSSGNYLSLMASDLKAAFYDISNPESPRYLDLVSQSGTYVDSRLSDGVLYLVSSYSVQPEDANPLDPGTYVPSVNPGGGAVVVDPGDIRVLPLLDSPTYSLVTAIDVGARSVTSEKAVLGRADTLYMSPTSLYLASTNWGYYFATGEDTGEAGDQARVTIPGYEDYKDMTTNLVRIGLNGGALSVEADAVLPGSLINQFALDELDGYLRVVTTRTDGTDPDQQKWSGVQVPGLWVLDSSLALVGSLPELVTKEQVQSVRFDGTVGYVVTFERVDPLFAIDLSDPRNPQVTSALKIPGFSSYLHPFGPGLLLGVGMDADDSGQVLGVKLSMFDVSDPLDVREVATLPITADNTDVAYDHKAAFVDVERGLIGFPTQSYLPDTMNWDYRLVEWTGSAFREKPTITLFSSGNGGYPNDTTTRGVGLGDDFYLVTSYGVNVYEMAGYSQIAKVTLS